MSKRKIKNLLVLILIAIFFGSSSIIQAQKIPQIPQDIRNQMPEKDWIELYCYEAKSRGGEAVAKIEALAELLPPLLEKVERLGVKVEIPDLLSISKDLESKLEAVCQQTTLETAQAKLQEFISKANSIRDTLGPNLRSQIEPALKAKGEEIKAKLEKELRAEGERMGKEIEAKLRAQAEQEAKQIEARLREELKQQIEKELKAQFKGQKNIDKNYVLKLGRKTGEERGQKAAEKARKELKAKYERLAKQERKRITKLMEKKADEIGGEEKRKLEEIRDSFLNFETDLESLTQAKMARWLVFKEKAIQKKKEILIATMGAQIDKGKELIMAHKEEIDQARAEGKDIPSAEELVAQLEADKQSLIDKLSKGELDENLIRQAGGELKMKWEKIRFDMEKMKERAPREIYSTITTKLKEKGFSKNRIYFLEKNRKFKRMLEDYNHRTEVCRRDGFDFGKYPDVFKEGIVKLKSFDARPVGMRQLWCEDRFTKGSAIYSLNEFLIKSAEIEDNFIKTLKEFFEKYNSNSDVTSLLEIKEKLVEASLKYKKINSEMLRLSFQLKRSISDIAVGHYFDRKKMEIRFRELVKEGVF